MFASLAPLLERVLGRPTAASAPSPDQAQASVPTAASPTPPAPMIERKRGEASVQSEPAGRHGAERRRHPRFRIDRSVALTLGATAQQAILADLSLGGALVESPQGEGLGALVGVELTVGDTTMILNAQVVRSEEEGGQARLACKFAPLSEAERRHLMAYLDEHTTEISGVSAAERFRLPDCLSLLVPRGRGLQAEA